VQAHLNNIFCKAKLIYMAHSYSTANSKCFTETNDNFHKIKAREMKTVIKEIKRDILYKNKMNSKSKYMDKLLIWQKTSVTYFSITPSFICEIFPC